MANSKILVPTDFSDASEEAIRLGRDIAKHDGAVLALSHAIPEIWDVPDRSAHPWLLGDFADAQEIERRATEALAQKAAEIAKDGVQVETYIDGGEPHAAIVRRAEQLAASLVVVGSHGRTGLSRMVLGSVAEKVVRYAHSPVLVARKSPTDGPVVTGTDLSEAARLGVREAARLAAARKSELIVLHVVDLGWMGRSPFAVDTAALSAAVGKSEGMKEAERRLSEEIALATKDIDVKITRDVSVGDPAAVLVRWAEDSNARLVVVSTHGRTGLSRALLGSVAERVVRLSHTSVLAFRG
jgi:nucleotide-binding universal stress UspA family protein